MSLISEIFLSGIGSKSLEKPFVFLTMLISGIVFLALSVLFILSGVNNNSIQQLLAATIFLVLFFACSYFVKRCFK